MISIAIIVRDDRTQNLTTYDLLAWLSWPFDLLSIILDAVTEAYRLIMTGTQIVTTGGHVKSYCVPTGAIGHPHRYMNVLTSRFTPFRRVVRYEARADFLAAIEHRGHDETTLIAAGLIRQQRDR